MFREQNAPVSHSSPSPVLHSGGKGNHTPRNRAGPLLLEWLTELGGAGERMGGCTVSHPGGWNQSHSESPSGHQSGFQGEGEPAVHKSPMCSPGFPGGASSKEPACQCRSCKKRGSTPGSGRSPGGHGNPLQYSWNPMDRGAWWATSPHGRKELDTTEAT